MRVLCAAETVIDFEAEPIRYSHTTPDNRLSRLQTALEAGEKTLERTDARGYLVAVLKELSISPATQVLPFAKASLQDERISPATPRAIYFNDDTYLGYVQQGLLELAVFDPKLGMVFYTLAPTADPPRFHHETTRCLTCHGGARTRHVPGLLVRSVYPGPGGQPIVSIGQPSTSHCTPFEQRWGGWYVSGTHGNQPHLGNFKLTENKRPESINNAAGQNITDLSRFFDVTPYLAPHSDLVALMVLEHQIDTQNVLIRANFEARIALHKAGLPESTRDISLLPLELAERVDASVEAVVKQLLFSGEIKLTVPIRGTSDFVSDFAKRGPTLPDGRSLREFDLQTRLFQVPLSYMLFSPAFNALPPLARARVLRRLNGVLTETGSDAAYSHLSADDRAAAMTFLMLVRE